MALVRPNNQAGSAKEIVVTLTAKGTISALRLVRAFSDTEVSIAEPGTIFEDAQVFGIALSAAVDGAPVSVLVFGSVSDAFFTTFPVNSPLFLGAAGIVTISPPLTGHWTSVGKSLGSGKIFIDIEEPIVLN